MRRDPGRGPRGTAPIAADRGRARGRMVGRLRFDNTCGAGCVQVWQPPPHLVQPLRAVPEVDLGPFRFEAAAFRFRLRPQDP